MNKRTSGLLFLSICIILAILLLTSVITPIVSGCLFAASLIFFGVVSRGFKK